MPAATSETRIRRLREIVRESAANRPGVYRMVAKTGLIVYVGKSKRIRTRLLGYFRARQEEKAWRIVREADSVEWEYVPSEFAALLRELELIKRYRPHYNVHQKRDGLYCYLRITTGPAPKLQVVRRITDEPGSYFGPLRGGRRIAEAVRELNDVLLLRDCRRGTPIHFSDQQDLFGVEMAPLCSRFELRRCLGPCAGRCSESEYAQRVELAGGFLTSDIDEPVRELADRMRDAADRLEFEHAAALRNRISRLEMLRSEYRRFQQSLEKLSFLYAVPGIEGEHRIYAIRSGSIREVYPAPKSWQARRRLLAKAAAHFRNPERGADATSRERVEQVLLVGHWFRTRPGEHSRTYSLERGSELPLAKQLGRIEPA